MANHFSPDKEASDKSYSKWGGFLTNIELFDARFFGITEDDALMMDPSQRLLLEVTQELLDRSGYKRAELDEKKVGIFIGGGSSAYHVYYHDKITNVLRKHAVVNQIPNMLAGRIADTFNFMGPACVIDTACSSSLVSIHQACQSILSGESEFAVAGGVELLISPESHINFSKASVLSDDGRCYVFDERAKGLVLGEGVGLVLLKKYEQALQDGDNILGVILSSGMNNDGHTPGITVPNLKAQKALIQEVLKKSGVSPDTISYYEAHGTGTLLGDP
ncbi:MAG: polyketide synthase, partial [Gammaproteobacteria bacterium]